MVSNVRVRCHKSAVGIGQDALGSAFCQRIEIGARHVSRAENSGVELLGQHARQPLHHGVVKSFRVTSELIGERHDDCQRVRGHLLGGQSAALDWLLFGLSDPAGFRIAGNDRHGHAKAGQRNPTSQAHNGGGFLRLLQNIAGNSRGE